MRPAEITWLVSVRNDSGIILSERIEVKLIAGGVIKVYGLTNPCSDRTIRDLADAVREIRRYVDEGSVEIPAGIS